VEPAGQGVKSGKHGVALGTGKEGVIHGFNTLVMKDGKGDVKESYSAASGLDYPGVGPELAHLKEIGRMELAEATDEDAVEAFMELSKTEGIIPALESAHAVSYGIKRAAALTKRDIVVINLSGRGDKAVVNVINKFINIFTCFCHNLYLTNF
jgi:tryptophan synthase beta chain